MAAAVLVVLRLLQSPVIAQAGPQADVYLFITPARFKQVLAPLIEARKADGFDCKFLVLEETCAGAGAAEDAKAIDERVDGWNGVYGSRLRAAVRSVNEKSGGRLKCAFVIGAAKRKMLRDEIDRFAPVAIVPLYQHEDVVQRRPRFATDNVYADVDGDMLPDIAVGRLPAVSEEEVSRYVDKVLEYERNTTFGPGRAAPFLLAGGGGYGESADKFMEQLVFGMLDNTLPPAYEMRGVYCCETSPYCLPREIMGQIVAENLCSDAPICLYAGHGSVYGVAGFGVGSARQYLSEGRPGAPFFQPTCSSGKFDMEDPALIDRRCFASELVLQKAGPVACFASAEVSAAYVNFLIHNIFVAELSDPPERVGDLCVNIKRKFAQRSDKMFWAFAKQLPSEDCTDGLDERKLKYNHVMLFNLFGDPAARLKFPKMTPLEAKFTEGGVAFSAALPFKDGKARVSFSYPISKAPDMPELMAKGPSVERWQAAHKREIAAVEMTVVDGRVKGNLKLPQDLPRGDYVARMYAWSDSDDAVGGVKLACEPKQ